VVAVAAVLLGMALGVLERAVLIDLDDGVGLQVLMHDHQYKVSFLVVVADGPVYDNFPVVPYAAFHFRWVMV
jgi:hypothetical protein